MPPKAKRPVMTYGEMVEMNESKRGTRLYSKIEDGTDKVQALINQTLQELVNIPDRISLRDTQAVRNIALAYVNSCAQTGVLPSKMGLARACGITRKGIDDYMFRNPESETTVFLSLLFDAFAECLSNAALTGSCHPIFAIFVEKALFGWRDALTIEASPTNVLGSDEMTAADLQAKLDSELIVDIPETEVD